MSRRKGLEERMEMEEGREMEGEADCLHFLSNFV